MVGRGADETDIYTSHFWGAKVKIKSKFVDKSGERVSEEVLPPTKEGETIIEDTWVRSFWELLLDALHKGDDVEIEIVRTSSSTVEYIS